MGIYKTGWKKHEFDAHYASLTSRLYTSLSLILIQISPMTIKTCIVISNGTCVTNAAKSAVEN